MTLRYELVYLGLGDIEATGRPWHGPGEHLPPGSAAPLVEGEPVTIGRSTHATICCFSNGVARLHVRATLAGDVLVVDDLGSTNGTWVAGARVERVELRPGEEIALAGVFRFGFRKRA